MTAGPSYRTPGPLPSPASGFVGREADAADRGDEAVARALRDTGTFTEPA